MMQMKKGHFDSKTGGNGSKNWIGILRPAINEWRPKNKANTSSYIFQNIFILSYMKIV